MKGKPSGFPFPFWGKAAEKVSAFNGASINVRVYDGILVKSEEFFPYFPTIYEGNDNPTPLNFRPCRRHF